jgi:ferritin-like protein
VLLTPDLDAEAAANTAAARRLADRIGELGGTVTADPSRLLERAGIAQVVIPDDPGSIGSVLGYALAQIRKVLPTYDEVVHRLRGIDMISYQPTIELYAALVTREDEIESSLMAPKPG